jgi:hypothetical protein
MRAAIYKRLTALLLIGLILWATADAFIFRPNDFYSPISRGKLIGIILVVLLLPVVYSLYLYTKTYMKMKNHHRAFKSASDFSKNWLRAFIPTKKRKR